MIGDRDAITAMRFALVKCCDRRPTLSVRHTKLGAATIAEAARLLEDPDQVSASAVAFDVF